MHRMDDIVITKGGPAAQGNMNGEINPARRASEEREKRKKEKQNPHAPKKYSILKKETRGN